MLIGFKVNDRKIGDFKLDATTAEGHSAELAITDNPIESGATISDHAVLKPKTVTISGVVVGYEPVLSAFSTPPKDLLLDAGERLGGIVLGRDPSVPELKTRAENIAKDFKKSFTKAMDDPLSFLKQYSQPILGTNNDRVSRYHQMILELQRQAVPVDVYTGTMLYKDMLIQSVGLTQEQDGIGKFTITLRQVVIVETVSFARKTSPKGKNRGGRNKNTTGKSETTVQPKKSNSFIKKLFG